MDDDVESLLIDVRASTSGFASDIAEMRGTLDTTLVDGFARAGTVLERGLAGAIRRGSLGFDELKRIASEALDGIAAQAARTLFTGIGGSATGDLGGLFGSLLGLPGRATGGPVAPGRGYLVGERGPEVFVPGAAGRVETVSGLSQGGRGQAAPREVRVAINVVSPAGSSAPQSLQRSTRQVASAVRRALRES